MTFPLLAKPKMRPGHGKRQALLVADRARAPRMLTALPGIVGIYEISELDLSVVFRALIPEHGSRSPSRQW